MAAHVLRAGVAAAVTVEASHWVSAARGERLAEHIELWVHRHTVALRILVRCSAVDNEVVIGRLHHVVLDCPDPRALAEFYSRLLGRPVTYESADWVVVAENDQSSGLAFQRSPDHQPPRWPDPAYPQQLHLDVMVDDLAAAADQVVAIGARRATDDPAHPDVYLDPAGHPFCLIPRPAWAPPIHGSESA
jgi:catechol 2,3-dioxygenase-like lactoylglutathione lyase family enzyme